jgi:hypothetical protein
LVTGIRGAREEVIVTINNGKIWIIDTKNTDKINIYGVDSYPDQVG